MPTDTYHSLIMHAIFQMRPNYIISRQFRSFLEKHEMRHYYSPFVGAASKQLDSKKLLLFAITAYQGSLQKTVQVNKLQ